MNLNPENSQRIISLVTIALILLILPLILFLVQQRQLLKKRAEGPITDVSLHLIPASTNFALNETKIFDLKASFTNGSTSEYVGFIKTSISFPKEYLQMPANQYIDISQSGLNGVVRITNPVEANQTGTIFIELGIGPTQQDGPSTAEDITIARIPFQAKQTTSQPQNINFGSSQVHNEQGTSLNTVTQGATFTIGPEEEITTQAQLSLQPASTNFAVNQTKLYQLKASFTNGSTTEQVAYFKTAISFPTQYLMMPSDQYVDIFSSGLNAVIRVTNPVEANQTGTIFIELGIGPNQQAGPPTDKDIIIAKIPLQAKTTTSEPQSITIEHTSIRNKQATAIPTTTRDATFTIGLAEETSRLNFKIAFQGVSTQQCDQTVTITLKQAGQEGPEEIPVTTQNASFTITGTNGETQPNTSTATNNTASLHFDPASANFSPAEIKSFDLIASFENGSLNEHLAYIKTSISFPTNYLTLPENQYIDVSQAGLDGVIRVTNPVEANQTGTIFIELGIGSNQQAGPSLDGNITIARIPFQAKNITSEPQSISIDTAQMLKENIGSRQIFDDVKVNPIEDGIYLGTITNFPAGSYDVIIKGWAHLGKKFEAISLTEGENNQDFSSTPLPVGDFNDDNILDISDITAIISKYSALSNPVTDDNQDYDVDCNNKINIFDPSLALTNYIDYEVRGD